MNAALTQLLSRRTLVGAAAAAAPSFWATRATGQQSAPTAVTKGDCEDEPAIRMLFDWRAGKSVYQSVADSGPQIDWKPFNHPSLLAPFLIPSDWTGIAGWADTFSRDGVPEWQDQPMTLPQLTLSRIISPDGKAAFEYAIGSIHGTPLNTQQTAMIAKQSVVGPNPALRPVCSIDDQFNPLSPSWFTADKHKSSILVTTGNALQMPDVYLPATVVSFTNLFGPRKDMEQVMYDVFLRILFQFLGGGGSDPTPTSTAGI